MHEAAASTLSAWENFYVIVGSSAGALTGLQFVVMTLIAFGLTNLGLLIAWRMESTQGFHAIMNLVLLPIWLLSGAFFPQDGLPGPLAWVMRLDPLTYGLAALRRCLAVGPGGPGAQLPALLPSVGITVLFAALAFAGAVVTARRSQPL